MAKNLIFLADGTGNDSDSSAATNVYKLYQRLQNDVPGHHRMSPDDVDAHLKSHGISQITQYDPGVGSRKTDFVGKATGRGISKNIKDGYEFLTRFYEPGDRIFLFGFSRGAYTVRSLSGLIGYCGIPRRQAGDGDLLHDEPLRRLFVNNAYDIYKLEGYEERKARGDKFIFENGYEKQRNARDRAVYCIGVWDTVRALGYARGWKDIEIPGFRHRFHDHELSRHVRYAFHALSIDDPRREFFPTIWNEPTRAQSISWKSGRKNPQTFEQVWFPGVHSDIGGGYEESLLSDITLAWMIDKVRKARHSPQFYALYDSEPKLALHPDPMGMMHNPEKKLWEKVIFRTTRRYVRRGKQEPGSRWIEPIEEPSPVSWAWLERFVGKYGTTDPYAYDNMLDHQDVKKARSQVKKSKRPLPGPFKYFV